MLQSVDGGCTSLDLPLIGSAGHSCYNDSGTSYKGKASVSESGVKCNIWPESMMPAVRLYSFNYQSLVFKQFAVSEVASIS